MRFRGRKGRSKYKAENTVKTSELLYIQWDDFGEFSRGIS